MSDSTGKDSIAAVPVCGASGSVEEASGVAGSLGLECATVADEIDPVQVPGLPDAGLPSAGGGHVNVENPGVGPSGVLLEMPNDVAGLPASSGVVEIGCGDARGVECNDEGPNTLIDVDES